MHHSKLISILKSLDPTEFRQFYRYLQAPLLTQSKDVLNLYDVVRKHYPTFDSSKLDRQKVFKKLYPKKAFDGNRFSILLFKLTKILDEYLIFLKFQQDEFGKKKLLTQIYGERNLNVIFKKNTKELLKELEGQPYRDTNYFFNKYLIQKDFYFHDYSITDKENLKFLESALVHLNNFFCIERLNLGIDLKNREKIYSEKNIFNFSNPIDHIPSGNLTYQLLSKCFILLEQNKESDFFSIKTIFQEKALLLKKKDALVIFFLLLNFAIQHINKNATIFSKEAFELQKFGLEVNLIPINETSFLNIVVIGASLKDFVWVENFINNYCKSLESSSHSIIQLAKGYLFLNKAEYDNVINILLDFHSNNPLYKINSKSLIIRSLYKIFENNATYYTTLLDYCKSFEKHLKRATEVNEIKIQAYLNFILIIKKLANAKQSRTNNTKEYQTLVLTSLEPVHAQKWLLENI